MLADLTPGPVVTLNRAVAVAETRGPAAGLALVDPLLDDPPCGVPTACTPSAPTSSSAPVVATRPARRTSSPPDWPPASPSSGTSRSAPLG